MTDSIEFLTGHDIAEFMAGQFSFAESISTYLIVIVCILLAMLSWLFYRRTTGPLSLSVRTMLIAMRASILVLLFWRCYNRC